MPRFLRAGCIHKCVFPSVPSRQLMWPSAGFPHMYGFIRSPPDPPNRRWCQQEEMKLSGVSIFIPTYCLSKSTQALSSTEGEKTTLGLNSTSVASRGRLGSKNRLELLVPEWETLNSIWALVNQGYLPLGQQVGRRFFCGFGWTWVKAYPPPFPGWVEHKEENRNIKGAYRWKWSSYSC